MNFLKNDLSFFDCNAFIGNHKNPFIDSPFEINDLENSNRKSGIKKSLIYHSASVFYDASYGNELLIKTIKDKPDFYSVWIAVPELCRNKKRSVEGREDFFLSIKKNKISAIKIFPKFHNYDIKTGALDDLFSFLNEEKIPLLIDQEEILWEELAFILERFKNIPVILQNAGYRMERYLFPFFSKYKNFYMDAARYQSHGGLEYFCGQFGSEQILFGSGIPVFSPEPIMMMIDSTKISLEEKQNFSFNNLLRILNLEK